MNLWTKPTLPEFAVLAFANIILWSTLASGHLDAFRVLLHWLTLCAL